MIKSLKRKIVMISMVLVAGLSAGNCALFDPAQNGPSCTLAFNIGCLDLMSIDAADVATFESDCTDVFLGTFDSAGCDLTVFDVPGHCEVTGSTAVTWDYAVWYSTDLGVTEASAQAGCEGITTGTGTWVPSAF